MRHFTRYPGSVALFNSCMLRSFSLAAWKGHMIRVQFRATTDGSLATSFRVDDVSLQ